MIEIEVIAKPQAFGERNRPTRNWFNGKTILKGNSFVVEVFSVTFILLA
jgi:hypothetical protein